MYSFVAIKTEVFFTSLNECSPKRSFFEMLESALLKKLSARLRSLLKSVSLSFEYI